jgi:hypothetical protein
MIIPTIGENKIHVPSHQTGMTNGMLPIDRAFQQAHQETSDVQDHCSQGAFLKANLGENPSCKVANGLPSGNLT